MTEEIAGGLTQINARQFDLYALSLERGPNFGDREIYDAYKSARGEAAGAILIDPATWAFSTITMRRQVDHRWVQVDEAEGFADPDAAKDHLKRSMRIGDPAEPLPPSTPRRKPLLEVGPSGTSPEFELLASSVDHLPALTAVGECYLALPKPDANFVTDFQTSNFASRLFELYLLACFREQSIAVRQDHPSPDFLIERGGASCWIEAVTANSPVPRSGGIGPWVHAPEDRDERLTGATAERFAKTLRGKLQRNYETLPHVAGQSFAIAIADFHESGSMVWSREALPTYLYGVKAYVEGEGADRRAAGVAISHLTGKDQIPAGIFRDPDFAHLSGVIFSNAATLAKFNRMGFLAGWQPPGLDMVRHGILFDRSPGVVDAIPFELSISSPAYEALWPQGEAWCQELEVFHNPRTSHPIPFDLIPGATHWFEKDGEIVCSTIWANSVLSSVTDLRWPRR
ncbi:hypothetical protein M2337_002389 [Sphingobium sp. B2D3A]|uniref:hypothetical protein n=1 Tax=unclassified Sphingobium TaxID=2611147 RepID=UPI0022243AC2|nr:MULTISPECIES: hypothetical protein [unclassified Sphingobium]MCW2338156.1 hypothetical protein [Sphingobium sp. B2D3A]MCW2384615.1 hypothetical protein [Sphingobium sp. B2D3D]